MIILKCDKDLKIKRLLNQIFQMKILNSRVIFELLKIKRLENFKEILNKTKKIVIHLKINIKAFQIFINYKKNMKIIEQIQLMYRLIASITKMYCFEEFVYKWIQQ